MQQVFCLLEDNRLVSFFITIMEVLAHAIRVVYRYPLARCAQLSFFISDIFVTLLKSLLRFFESAFDLSDFDFDLGY